jgi:hypothetical protein
MLAIYSIAIILCLASVLIGEATLRVCGYPPRTQLAPAVGLGVMIALACAVFWLPGHGRVAAVMLVLATLLASARLVRERVLPDPVNLAVALAMLAVVSIPFLVNRHVGVFGVSIDDDFAAHFTWASSLEKNFPGSVIYPNYPLGPHELADALASLFRTSVEAPFTAILLAVPVLTALTAQAALKPLGLPARVLGGLLVGMPYLIAAHLGEGAFKELTMALLLSGLALTLRQLQRETDWNPRRALPLGVMLAATLLVYGRSGLVWPLAGGGLWVVATAVQWRVRPSRAVLRVAGLFLAVLLLCTLLASLSELTRIVQFSGGVPGGNVATDPSPFEVLGVWFSGDFRVSPGDGTLSTLLIAGSLAIAACALVWWVRRRDLAVPAAAVASLLIYAIVRQRTGPYLTSKALVVAATPLMLALVVPLFSACRDRWRAPAGAPARLASAAGIALIAACFVAAALWSSGFALRYARVGSDEQSEELSGLRMLTQGAPTLGLVPGHFIAWGLRGARLSTLTPYGTVPVIPFEMRKPLAEGGASDVDAIAPSSLERFRYLLTTTSRYGSEMPPNWHLAAHTKAFALWRRTGSTPERQILQEGAAPGALFDCKSGPGRRLSRLPGVAAVWSAPPVGPSAAWSLNGVPLAPSPAGFIAVTTGSKLTQALSLPAGRWELSLPYQGPAHLYLSAAELHAILPSRLDLLGPYWRVGEVQSTGRPILVTLSLQQMRFDAAVQSVAVGGLVAVRMPRRISHVPLARACGRYVDWYETRPQSVRG